MCFSNTSMRLTAFLVVISLVIKPACFDEASLPEKSVADSGRAKKYSNSYIIKGDMTSLEARELCENKGLSYVIECVPSYFVCKDDQIQVKSETKAAINVQRELQNDDRVVYVEQDEYVQLQLDVSVSDPQWNDMWHLQPSHIPSMNIYDVWEQGYTGHGVVVGIVDTGIDPDHTDIVVNYRDDLGYDAINNDDDPSHSSADSGHGTSCAGIVAAVKNDICSIGVAYNAEIAAIKKLDEEIQSTWSGTAAALTHALDFIDIYSNSWGYVTRGESSQSIHDVMREALLHGVTNGRNGKGAIYTFSAGNGEKNNEDTNAQEHKRSIYTIVIGSVSPDGTPAWYSEPGATILASTYGGDTSDNPIGIITLERYNQCRTDFQGTSAACPVASGIIALALEVNSELTWRDVQHLIVETSNTSGLSGDTFITNGAGKIVSNYFGFGLMDAAAMIEASTNWQHVSSLMNCSTDYLWVNSGTVFGDISHTTFLPDCGITLLEQIHVRVSIDTVHRGAIQINLVSPAGTRSRLMRYRPNALLNGWYRWEYGSVQFWGEHPTGDWTIELIDGFHTEKELKYWNFTIYGSEDFLGCSTVNPCLNGGTCVDQTSSFTCVCPTGYLGSTCAEIDECATSPCQNLGTCTDGDNTYTCTCPTNYSGDNCENYNECLDKPCMNDGDCTDEEEGYTCICFAAYTGDRCQHDSNGVQVIRSDNIFIIVSILSVGIGLSHTRL